MRTTPCWEKRCLVVLACLVAAVTAGEDDEDAKAREAHRERMKKIAQSVHVFGRADKDNSELPLAAEPVLRYTDPTRKTFESGLWIWGKGRPSAIGAFEYYPQSAKGPRWLYEIVSLSAERIAVRAGDELNWTAKQPGLTSRELPMAPVPADKPAGRLAQLRELMRRFTAHEKATVEGRIELRPLVKPLHRYEDADAGVIDGAVLCFASGTNPEVFLILEARRRTGAPPRWEYSLAQMTGEAATVELDGEKVWTAAAAEPPAQRDSYINGYIAPVKE